MASRILNRVEVVTKCGARYPFEAARDLAFDSPVTDVGAGKPLSLPALLNAGCR